MTETLISLRIDDDLRERLDAERLIDGIDRSLLIRRLLQEALKQRRIAEAVRKYFDGRWGATEAAAHAQLDIREFVQELNKSGQQIPIRVPELMEMIENAEKVLKRGNA